MTANNSAEAAFIRVANAIRQDILKGSLLSGNSLIEVELSAKYGASRNTLREALQLLRQQGLVTQERNKSVRVKRLTECEVHDIFIVRRVIEIGAIRAIKQLADENITRFQDVIRKEIDARDRSDWQSAGTESLMFHKEIVALHGSQIFNDMFAILASQLRLVFASGHNEQAFQRPWLVKDAEIFTLLKDGAYEQAALYLEEYLTESEQMLTGMVRQSF